MPTFEVNTGRQCYSVVVEAGVVRHAAQYLPPAAGNVFVTTTNDVWQLHGRALLESLPEAQPLFFPGGEANKRLVHVEALAEQIVGLGGDRSSVVVAFGGGIVGDMGGFLAAAFMRGIPVVQVPTTLLAQVDAAVGGKTGVNLQAGKNLFGAFHQPHCVLIDPSVLKTLPEREYRAGLFEVLKHGVIASEELFNLMERCSAAVMAQSADAVLHMIAESVRIKAEVVSADEREGGLRRILNFGHTFGHALEAETAYSHFLHGEAVAIGMRAATNLAMRIGMLSPLAGDRVLRAIDLYGPFPSLSHVSADAVHARMDSDKKTVKGKIHFVLPDRIGHVEVRSGIDPADSLAALKAAFQ